MFIYIYIYIYILQKCCVICGCGKYIYIYISKYLNPSECVDLIAFTGFGVPLGFRQIVYAGTCSSASWSMGPSCNVSPKKCSRAENLLNKQAHPHLGLVLSGGPFLTIIKKTINATSSAFLF